MKKPMRGYAISKEVKLKDKEEYINWEMNENIPLSFNFLNKYY